MLTVATNPTPKIIYVETSALLRVILESDAEISLVLRQADRIVTSSLTLVEADRGIRRAVTNGRLTAIQERRAHDWLGGFATTCELVDVDDLILNRVKQDFPVEPVRAMDALHLTSAQYWITDIEPLTVVSCDRRVRDNCAVWEYPLFPVLHMPSGVQSR